MPSFCSPYMQLWSKHAKTRKRDPTLHRNACSDAGYAYALTPLLIVQVFGEERGKVHRTGVIVQDHMRLFAESGANRVV